MVVACRRERDGDVEMGQTAEYRYTVHVRVGPRPRVNNVDPFPRFACLPQMHGGADAKPNGRHMALASAIGC